MKQCCIAGSRFQTTGNQDEKEDVAPEHEDKIDRVGNNHCLDSHHNFVCLSWFQLLSCIELSRGYSSAVTLHLKFSGCRSASTAPDSILTVSLLFRL